MKNVIQEKFNKITNGNVRKKRWYRLLAVLTFITVFCTTYALILPAITLDRIPDEGGQASVEAVEKHFMEDLNAGAVSDRTQENADVDSKPDSLPFIKEVTDYLDINIDEIVDMGKADASEDEKSENASEEKTDANADGDDVNTSEKTDSLVDDGPGRSDTEFNEPGNEENINADSTGQTEGVAISGTSSDGAKVVVSGDIPEGAEVSIDPVNLSEAALNKYIGDASETVQQYVAYDITILVDGEEWQPDSAVSVKINRPAINIGDKDRFEVVHVDSKGNAETVEAAKTKNGDVLFEAEGFSLYIIYTYTVDFHYNDFTFSIPGGESVLLSELFEALGIDVDAADVKNVEFSDESLVKPEKHISGDKVTDWVLNSLEAFSTEEVLTVTLNNDETIVIHVTDSQDGGNTNGGKGDHADRPSDPVPAPDYIGHYPTGIGSTQWQITKQEYTGREQSKKIPVDSDRDGKVDVYLQKNVVPTNVENEFLVYLSADKQVTWEGLFDHAGVGVTTSNKYGKDVPGTVHDEIVGNVTTQLAEKGERADYTNRYFIKFNVYKDHNSSTPAYVYTDWRYGHTSNCSNGTAYLKIPGIGCTVAAQKINLHNDTGTGEGNPFELNIYMDSIEDSIKTDLNFYDVVFNTVTDVLGDEVEFMQFVNCDGQASYNENTHTIIWNPVDNPDVVPDMDFRAEQGITGWNENIIQLVYRVKLNIHDEDFVSCADTINSIQNSIAAGESFEVNDYAKLEYDKIALENADLYYDVYGLEADFPVPEVRGLLYDIVFQKVNEKGTELDGAEFALFESDGRTPVLDENGQPMKLTTSKNAVSRFAGLPFGTYVLKETRAPAFYNMPAQNSWTVRLCYTDTRNVLVQDEAPYEHNMRYSGKDTNGQWRIVNTRAPFKYSLKVLKVDEKGNPLSDVSFAVTDPAHAGQTLTQLTGADGTCSYDVNFNPDVTYVLSETAPPEGYLALPEAIKFKVSEDAESGTYKAVIENSDALGDMVSIELKEERTESADEYILEVTVQNEEIHGLPDTGGPGTLIYTLGGIMVILTALIISLCLRCRRGRMGEI